MRSVTKPAKGVPAWQFWRDRFRAARATAREAAEAAPSPPTLRPPPRASSPAKEAPPARAASVFARRG